MDWIEPEMETLAPVRNPPRESRSTGGWKLVQHITTQKTWKPVGQSRQDPSRIGTPGLVVILFQSMAVAPVERRSLARNAPSIVCNANNWPRENLPVEETSEPSTDEASEQ
jgi:hypothetical protein